MHLEIPCVAAPVHILIDSSGENTKCVTHAFPVSCAGDAGHLGNRINSHQAGDTFDITTNGGEVCATRTDSGGGWGMHLEIACIATGETELEGPIVSAPALNILIDNSNENTRCVDAPVPVICADDAGHLGNRINSHQAGDTFGITVEGTRVCATRTDSGGGWGMHLEIACVAAPVHVLIDSSGENTKCVESSVPVVCGDDAGHLGNRVNSHQAGDTFEITTNGLEVCARRTDSGGGWGMHLEIVCVSGPPIPPVVHFHLARRGAATCDHGTPLESGACLDAVTQLAANTGASLGRAALQQGSGGGCLDGSWGQVPGGCSAQSGGDWAAHYKSGSALGDDCISAGYQLVCTGALDFHLAPGGAATCDHGTPLQSGACLDAVSRLAANTGASLGRAALQQGSGGGCMDGGWGQVPGGCSAQSGGDWGAHYKSGSALGDGCVHAAYQLVCTGESLVA